MATFTKRYASTIYEQERADRMMELAAKVAALPEERTLDEVRTIFNEEPWFRASPAIGVDAFVLNPDGEILLIQRTDSGKWAMPGGFVEIGNTFSEAVLRELWEEAGLRGEVQRILGIFDNRVWGENVKVHLVHHVYEVACKDFAPSPGIECLAAGFFPLDGLPEMHPYHDKRIEKCDEARRTHHAYIDPAQSYDKDMPMHQRGEEPPADA